MTQPQPTNQTPNQELEIRGFTDERLSDEFVDNIQNMIRLAKAQGAKEERGWIEKIIVDAGITCGEDIYQSDRVSENLPDTMLKICQKLYGEDF